VAFVIVEDEAERRNRMEARATKRENEMSVRIRFRDIGLFAKGGEEVFMYVFVVFF
jgi:hypothetical protein